MSKEEWIEENRDALEKRYHEAYMITLEECLDGIDEAFQKFEKALIAMGILEDDEPEAENEAEHWDEYMTDLAIDLDRERMAYER